MARFINEFVDDVFHFITHKTRRENCHIVKKHVDHLETFGDFSFPNSVEPWRTYLENIESSKVLDLINSDLVKVSLEWTLPLSKCEESQGRVCLFLDRPQVFMKCLSNIEDLITNSISIDYNINFKVDSDVVSDISALRLDLLCNVAQNLTPTRRPEDIDKDSFDVCLTLKSSYVAPKGIRKFLCGSVLSASKKAKEHNYSGADFIRKRRSDMQLIAEHKFGMRFDWADTERNDIIEHIGEAAATFELLQVKPSHTVTINFEDHGNETTRGAAFVLYNCARLKTLLETYKSKEKSGMYPSLPPVESIDYSLLVEEDEWVLLFNYILGFTPMLEQCLQISQDTIKIAPHLLCAFLSSMVKTFSVYYRRIKIFTEPRPHMLPVLHARIHLLIGLERVMHAALKLLNIKPVQRM